MADSVAEIEKAQKLYLKIGVVLFIFTGVTVAVATVPWLDIGRHGFDMADMILGLLIASFKASLVLIIFMHLNHERSLIYQIIILSAVFGATLFLLTGWAYEDPIEYGTPTLLEMENNNIVPDGFYIPPSPPAN